MRGNAAKLIPTHPRFIPRHAPDPCRGAAEEPVAPRPLDLASTTPGDARDRNQAETEDRSHLATTLAVATVVALGEHAEFRRHSLPWLRFFALVPPLVLFAYAPYLGKVMYWHETRDWFAVHFAPDSLVPAIFGRRHLVLILATIAYWPLVISGIHRYAKLGEAIDVEIASLGLPRLYAARKIKVPAVLQSISPAFQTATVLTFVACYAAETTGGSSGAQDGIAAYYLYKGQDNTNREILLLGMLLVISMAVGVLVACDAIASYFTGDRHGTSKGAAQ